MWIFDAHLDLAFNALDWNRNLEWSIAELRAAEAGMTELGRQTATVTLPELRTAGVRMCVATLFTRLEGAVNHDFGRITKESCYASAMAHHAYYRALVRRGLMRLIGNRRELAAGVQACEAPAPSSPLQAILSMECADPILDAANVAEWFDLGVRAIGLTHYGVNRYGGGTRAEVGLFPEAKPVLKEMERLGIVLDLTHLSDQAHLDALKWFDGKVIASHQNSRKWANWQRQFTDEQIQAVIDRDGVLGMACDAIMLQEGWVRGVTKPEVTLERVVDNIDHICQLAGTCRNVGIGTDLDGGYGYEQTPADLNTIADLQRLPDMLSRRGYAPRDIAAILHGNWVRFFEGVLPA